MDEWELEVMVSNATGLKKVSTLEQNPYCSVWYTQGDARRICTHKKGGTNPTWDKVVRLPIKLTYLESLHGSVLVEILHESRARDGKIGTAIIPLVDMKSGEGAIRMYDVDPVGKVGVALMRKKKETAALTSGGRGGGTEPKMTIKIYGMWASGATNKVLVLLLEKDIEFHLISVDVIIGDQKQPDYLALQPFGQIPVFQDGDFTMFESLAIMRHICEEYPNLGPPSLYGSNLIEKARVEQWLEVEQQQMVPILKTIYHQFMGPVFGGKNVDHKIIADETEKLAKVLDVYEAHLAKNKYLAGDFLSIADLSHLPTCYGVFTICKHQEVLKTRKHFAAWWNEISRRPAWLKVVENAAPMFDAWQNSIERCISRH